MLQNRIPPPIVVVLMGACMWLVARSGTPVGGASSWRGPFALGVAGLGLAILLFAVRAFARANTTIDPVNIDRASTVVTAGIFGVTRNPMYVGFTLLLLAWAGYLAVPAVFVGPVFFVWFTDRFQIVPEERAGPAFLSSLPMYLHWYKSVSASVRRRVERLGERVPALRLIPALAGALLAGCSGAPVRPDIPVPGSFLSSPATVSPGPSAEAAWWHAFGDPTLDTLVDSAAASNLDVRAAAARVAQARAAADIATGALLPSLNAASNVERNTTTYDAAVRRELPNVTARQVAGAASWEIDLFGAARAERRASLSRAVAAEQQRRAVLLMVVSETARQYVEFRGAVERRQIITDLLTTERDTLQLTELRRSHETASDFDVARARGDLADTAAQLPPLDTLIAVTRFRLTTLAGRAPGSFDSLLNAPTTALLEPVAAPVSQPAVLLERRPDVLAAEAMLAVAEHGETAARDMRYPQIFLSALLGDQWTSVNAVDIGRAKFTQVAGVFALPVFAGGRIQANIRGSDARRDEALAQYQQSIVHALEDVEASLVRLHQDAERSTQLVISLLARETALDKAQLLYQAGQTDLLELLDSQRGLLASRLAKSATQTDQLQDAIELYRALGGGWQVFVPNPVTPSSTAAATTSQTNHAYGDQR